MTYNALTVAEYYFGPDLRKVRFEAPSNNGSKPAKTFRWEHLDGDTWKAGDRGLPKPLYANSLFREKDQLGLAFPPEPEPVGVLLDSVTEQQVSWLWQNRVPRGALTILDGDAGTGKSLLALEIAARVSRGHPLPGETSIGEPGGVVIFSAEDSLGHVIKPRLRAAGADFSRILAVPYSANYAGQPTVSKLPQDLPLIELAIQRVNARLVIFDVLVAYIPATLSTQRDQDVRLALAPLAELADRMRVACLCLRHLNKNVNGPALYRGGGSIGTVGAARSGLLLASDPVNPDVRVLAVIKSNLGAPTQSVSFKIMVDGGVPNVEWTGSSGHTAESLLAVPVANEDRSAREEAAAFLLEELKDGPKEAIQILQTAKSLGISERTLKRAKESLAKSAKRGGAWHWTLASKEAKET